jgi:hypothetical protein
MIRDGWHAFRLACRCFDGQASRQRLSALLRTARLTPRQKAALTEQSHAAGENPELAEDRLKGM